MMNDTFFDKHKQSEKKMSRVTVYIYPNHCLDNSTMKMHYHRMTYIELQRKLKFTSCIFACCFTKKG